MEMDERLLMEAETLYYKDADKYSPFVMVKNSGVILLKGRSIVMDAQQVYKPICWAINKIVSDSITMEIDLEYMNQSTKKYLNIILRILSHQPPGMTVKVLWNTLVDDMDTLDYAHILRELYPRINFVFYA